MTRRQFHSAIISSLLVAAGIAGCAKPPHDPEENFVLVSANLAVPYWKTAQSGFFAAAAKLKVKAETVGPSDYNPQAQVEEFRKAVRRKPAGILVSVADPVLMKPEIDAAIAAGIPVISIDSDAPESKRLFSIGTNNYQAGLAGGARAAKLLNGKGNVIVFTMPGQRNLDERLKGYKDAFADHPGIKITDIIDIKGDPRITFDKTNEIMGTRKDSINGFICLEALSGREVATVLERYKIKGKVVVAMDTDDRTLEWIDKGWIDATISQKPYSMAYIGLMMLDFLHHNKLDNLDHNWREDSAAPIPLFVDTGQMLVDKENLGAFREANKAAPGK